MSQRELDPYRKTPPAPALAVVALLAVGVPFSAYLGSNLDEWQTGHWPGLALLAPYAQTVRIARVVGALALAVALILWRRPWTAPVVVTAAWLAGPPIDFLLHGMRLLALSSGKVAWQPDQMDWVVPSLLLPLFVSIALLLPASVRRSYAGHVPDTPTVAHR